MAGEPIDSFSVEIIADTDKLITNTQDAMRQIEAMLNDMVKNAQDFDIFGDPTGKVDTITESMRRITAALGDTLETSQLVERSIKLLTEAGMQQTIAFQTLADTIDRVSISAEGLEGLTDNEALVLQSEMLGKVNEGLTIMESAWVDTGNAIPVERLAALSDKLSRIFTEGINVQKLSLEEVFARMDEAIVESLVPLDRMQEKLSVLSPGQITFIEAEMRRAEQAFIDAGEAIPFKALDRLETQLIAIGKLAGEKNQITAGFERSKEIVDKLIPSLERVSVKQKELNASFTEWEQTTAKGIIQDNLRRIETAFKAAGKAVDPVALERYEKAMEGVIQAAARMGNTMPQAIERTVEITNKATDSIMGLGKQVGMAENKFVSLAQKIGGAFGVDTQRMTSKLQSGIQAVTKVASDFGINLGAISTAAMAAAAAVALLVVGIIVLTKLISDSIQVALRNADVHSRFNLVVRAQQRAIGDLALSQREASDAARQLGEDFGLTNVEAESLLATAMFLTREFKLTGKETVALADSAAVLAKQAGVSAESALRSVTQFMLTGYTRGLQRLGITISDQEVHLRAWKRGLVSLTGEVDNNTRAIIANEIINEEAAKSRDDAIGTTEEFAQQIKISSQNVDDAKDSLGQMFLGLKAAWDSVGSKVFVRLIEMLKTIILLTIAGAAQVQNFFAKINARSEARDELLEKYKDVDTPFGKNPYSDEEFETLVLEKQLAATEKVYSEYEDLLVRLGVAGKDAGDAAGGAAETFEEFEQRVGEASIGLAKTLEKLQEKFDESMERIQERLTQTLVKITKDFGRRRTDAARDLTRDVRDIDKDAQEDVVDEVKKHNETLFRLEEDHKLKMARLEDQFLFNLEDAVRERDARGVLMAIRRFNQQKKEMLQDKNLRTKRLKEDFKNELKEIEEERKKRRAERMLEFAEQSDDLAMQEARRREDARTASANAEQALRDANDRKKDILARGFLAQFTATNFSLNQLTELMNFYMGSGGVMEGIYDSIADYAAQTNLDPTLNMGFQTNPISDDTEGQISSPFDTAARGGTRFFTSPTMLLVGEGRPERVDITPLSESTGQPAGGFGGSGGGGSTDINLDVGLESGLQAELVDQTMDGVAEVILNISKKARK